MELVKYILLIFALVLSIEGSLEGENCDTYGVLFYDEIACKPVKVKGKSCPSKYNCDFSRPKSGCIFKGKTYGYREYIPANLTYSGCDIGCSCDNGNSIECAVLDCPESEVPNTDPGCYHEYELGNCCSSGQICNSTSTKKCEVDGETYEIGQMFYPKNTCFHCVCHEKFAGKYDSKTCVRNNCNAQIHYGSEISQNCAPVYFTYHSDEVLCCPDHFICPESSDTIKLVNLEADANSTMECSYGEKKVKLGEGLKRKVNKYGKIRDVECECILPPLLTCTERQRT